MPDKFNLKETGEMKNIKIYIMAHKAFEVPENQIYIPMQVGAALHDRLDYVGDDSGDHISAKNRIIAN